MESSDNELFQPIRTCNCKKELLALTATVNLQQSRILEQNEMIAKLGARIQLIIKDQKNTDILTDKVNSIEKNIADKIEIASNTTYSSLFVSDKKNSTNDNKKKKVKD